MRAREPESDRLGKVTGSTVRERDLYGEMAAPEDIATARDFLHAAKILIATLGFPFGQTHFLLAVC